LVGVGHHRQRVVSEEHLVRFFLGYVHDQDRDDLVAHDLLPEVAVYQF
jgi:hypothetical protein